MISTGRYRSDVLDKPKISVIIPAYNIENLIARCVESVVQQTYPAECMEILVVDDGSTDRTGQIIDGLAASYANVTALHEDNAGSSAARNYGLSKASGEYVGFVDSDDFIAPTMYEELVEALLRNHAKMAQTGRDEMAEDGTMLPPVVKTPAWETIYNGQGFLKLLLLHTGDASFCTKLTARSLFKEMQFPTGMLNEDFYLLYHMLPEAGDIVVLPKTGYHVFYRSGSNSRKKAEEKDYFPPVFTDIVRNADDVSAFVSCHYPKLSEYAMRFGLVQRLDYLLHIPISKMTKDNAFYMEVAAFVKAHKKDAAENPYLGRKQKLYLKLFAWDPARVRKIHAFLRRM